MPEPVKSTRPVTVGTVDAGTLVTGDAADLVFVPFPKEESVAEIGLREWRFIRVRNDRPE